MATPQAVVICLHSTKDLFQMHKNRLFIWMTENSARGIKGHEVAFEELLREIGFLHAALLDADKKELRKRVQNNFARCWQLMKDAGAILDEAAVEYAPWVAGWSQPGWDGDLRRPANWVNGDDEGNELDAEEQEDVQEAIREFSNDYPDGAALIYVDAIFHNERCISWMAALRASIAAQAATLRLYVPRMHDLVDCDEEINGNSPFSVENILAVLLEWGKRNGFHYLVRLRLGVLVEEENAIYAAVLTGQENDDNEKPVEIIWIYMNKAYLREGEHSIYSGTRARLATDPAAIVINVREVPL